MMLAAIRRHLSWKLFLSYLAIVVVGVLVLATATELTIPNSFQRHLAAMGSMMSQMMGDTDTNLNADLFSNFRAAVNEALLLAALAAFVAALVASLLISRRIVAPIREMMSASARIAEGHYDQRVEIPAVDPSEMDELANLALSFNQMAARLAKTETMRRELLADVAHELRTPLSAIKASMEGLIDKVLPEDGETYQRVYREADRMQRLVHDLQELSKVEAGAYELNLQATSLPALIEAVVARLQLQFEEKEVDLSVSIAPNLPLAMIDEGRVEQVLINLIGNALQYTGSGGQVRISVMQEAGELKVRIRDTGIGIPVEHLPHVFVRFYRVDKSRSRAHGGSGIGLTIARHLVEAHGGRIWAESDGAGTGSTFTFTLPAKIG
jgi:histidine kinase